MLLLLDKFHLIHNNCKNFNNKIKQYFATKEEKVQVRNVY